MALIRLQLSKTELAKLDPIKFTSFSEQEMKLVLGIFLLTNEA
jgi:hypothetical protein